jgi:signal transduction histidine kinase
MQTFSVHFSHPQKLLLPPEEQIILFRIIQEAVQNAVKHAHASNIDIDIRYFVSSLIVTVTDDGKGFDGNTDNTAGLGFKHISHRTQLLGGTLDCISSRGNGSKLIVKLPAKK